MHNDLDKFILQKWKLHFLDGASIWSFFFVLKALDVKETGI